MGNCLKPQSSKKRAYDTESDDGEDWSWPSPSPAAERETEEGYSTKNGSDFSGNKITEVKIKITKKQLEQLLGKMDVKELRVDQVLTQLMSQKGHGYEVHQHQRSWRPALQSIPELN